MSLSKNTVVQRLRDLNIIKLGEIQEKYWKIKLEAFQKGYANILHTRSMTEEEMNYKDDYEREEVPPEDIEENVRVSGNSKNLMKYNIFPIYEASYSTEQHKKFREKENLPDITTIKPEFLLSIFCEMLPPIKDDARGKYNAGFTLLPIKFNLGNTDYATLNSKNFEMEARFLAGIAKVLFYTPILKFKDDKNKNIHNPFIPPILNKYREMYGIKYEDWDVESILSNPGFLGPCLFEILFYNKKTNKYFPENFQRNNFPKTKEEILDLRKKYINLELWGTKPRHMFYNFIRWSNNAALQKEFNLGWNGMGITGDTVSTIPYMAMQTWHCNVESRQPDKMILDPTNWSNIPEAVDTPKIKLSKNKSKFEDDEIIPTGYENFNWPF